MRHHSMALRPVHRIKHVVDFNAQLAKATTLNIDLVKAVDAPVLGSTTQVETGSKVNGFYLKLEVASNDPFDAGAIPNVYMAILKSPANALSGLPVINAVGASDMKRFFIHQEMVMINNAQGGNPRILFNGVVVIPKGMRRMGPDDSLKCIIFSTAIDLVVCLQCHYKEFR